MQRGGGVDSVEAVAALGPPVRRQLFRLIGDGWTSRDEAAEALGVSRSGAAFHLDKLAEAGLAEVRYVRRTGRTGPGAGRPAKLYRRAVEELSASIPSRHYDLAGLLLARAVSDAVRTDAPVDDCLRDVARATGRSAGEDAAAAAGTVRTSTREKFFVNALAAQGYEPAESGSVVRLANCPFHRLAQDQPRVVCAMNFHFVVGLLQGLDATDRLRVRFSLEHNGRCCVEIERV